jgi:hypothetical protein
MVDRVLDGDFSVDMAIEKDSDTIVVETDQVYIPADRSWRRSADRRHLGLRIFRCEIRPAS